ncbi:type IV secretory system conjugative DNA transfer family protein [Parasediminibacterium sp. JCM 36343]|uniref:type IV secretory system conjugative DNA transfer family protein n=1 Tax=Parasediminibacterium sp. JCM 36343 TaxID=3374279 RepID=UPI00397C2DC3
MNDITPLGVTDWRNQHVPFGIKDADRLGHVYCIGKTGVGKSTLLLNMAISDIQRGKGIALIDPHGEAAVAVLSHVPNERVGDVIYFNPADQEYPICFNPLAGIPESKHHVVVSGLIATFRKIWADFWGPRMEHILRFSLFTLLQYPDATLLDIQPLLTDAEFRRHVLGYAKSDDLLSFWHNEFDRYAPSLRSEAVSPILNKLGIFRAHPQLRKIVGARGGGFQPQEAMDSGKVLVCNLSKGLIGEDASQLLGSMLVTAIQVAALGRAKYEAHERVPFYLYVDEMHSFVSLSFIDILSEARKYRLGLFLTHQYVDQLDGRIRDAIFGNVGTIISFRVGSQDAKYLAREFAPRIGEWDFIGLPKYSMYIKLMIDGATSSPFSAITHPLPEIKDDFKKEITQASRVAYCTDASKPTSKERVFKIGSHGSIQKGLFDTD